MKLLLDTHVWIWTITASRALEARAGRAIASPTNEIAISPVTIWETILLGDSGRLRLSPDPVSWIRRALAEWPLPERPITHEIAIASRRIRLENDDPADRFLAATAKVHDLTLVTADERLLACREIRTLRA